jgi:uncharacterized protein
MFIDFHTHVFHPKIAAKALAHLESQYSINPRGNGLAGDLLERLRLAGLDGAVVHTAATKPAQVVPANNWAIELSRTIPGLFPFGTIHPGFDRWEDELARLERNSILGVKLHPDFQGFDLADPALLPILESLAGRFVVLSHAGDGPKPGHQPSSPRKLATIKSTFPDLTLVAAHLGGYRQWEEALEYLAGTGIYLDTSSALPFLDDAVLRAILRKHPLERILFGSDYPLFDPAEEIERVRRRLHLTSAGLDRVLSGGANLLKARSFP